MVSGISIDSITKAYRGDGVEIRALRGISMEIAGGESLAVLGPSGSGKSTLLNILGCLDRPTSGRYLLDGVEVSGLGARELGRVRNRKLGFVFQGLNLLPRSSALENVELPMLYLEPRLPLRHRRERALQALDRVGLADRASHFPHQLSGGQQQRVAIARAIVNQAGVLLADEPTGSLDLSTGAEIMALFLELNRSGTTLIVVTHEPEVASRCRRQVVLIDGRIADDPLPRGRHGEPGRTRPWAARGGGSGP